jgi:hypothetical protein
MKISFDYSPGQFTAAQLIAVEKIKHASMAAVEQAGKLAEAAGRAAIAGGMSSAKWQNSLHAKFYPNDGLSPASVLTEKIPYWDIFETGGTITGHPLLWLPLNDAPRLRGGGIMTPGEFTRKVGVLYTIKRPGKPPLLAAVIRETGTRHAKKGVSLSQLRRGRNPGGQGKVRLVPLYVGVPSVKEPQLFDVTSAVKAAASAEVLAELYLENFEE